MPTKLLPENLKRPPWIYGGKREYNIKTSFRQTRHEDGDCIELSQEWL